MKFNRLQPWFGLAALIISSYSLCCAVAGVDPLPIDPPPAVHHPTGYKPLPPDVAKALHDAAFKRHAYKMAWLAKTVTPPAEFDCKDMGWIGNSGDQAQCGSCYLCSTVKTATAAAVKAGLGKVDQFSLSWQFGMDCHDFGGCNGGNGTEVIDWMVKNGWPAEADPNQSSSALYPSYVASVKQCRLPAGAKKFAPKDWLFITSDQSDKPATVAEYKAALITYGPVNVALDAGGQFSNYTSGVITSLGSSIDHEIEVVGYSDAKQAVLLENQWGQWGGAKTPGDDRAWLSYKAVGSLQDPFCVEFEAPQPPPVPPPGPTPPVPPGPTPPNGNLYTMTTDRMGVVTFTPAPGVLLPPDKVAELQKLLNAMNAPVTPPNPDKSPAPTPPVKPMPKPEPEAVAPKAKPCVCVHSLNNLTAQEWIEVDLLKKDGYQLVQVGDPDAPDIGHWSLGIREASGKIRFPFDRVVK